MNLFQKQFNARLTLILFDGYDLLQKQVIGNHDQFVFIRSDMCVKRLYTFYGCYDGDIFVHNMNPVADTERRCKKHD